ELTHVRFGSEWVKEFTQGDAERFERAQEFRRQVDKQFSFGGARSEREDAAIPIAWEDRKEAGFTDQELEELKTLSAQGPSKDTLLAAARVLRERHRARRAAEAGAGVRRASIPARAATSARVSPRTPPSTSRRICASCTAATTSRRPRAACGTSATPKSG